MAAKTPTSELVELLKLLRRIIVFGVAAYSLARGMPYLPLLVRIAILWGVLYICSGMIDVIFRRLKLSCHAARSDAAGQAAATSSTA